MREPGVLLTGISAVLVGLNAGFFYACSFTIMHSLDLIAADQAIAAMRVINMNIKDGWFTVVFFAAPVVLTGLIVYAVLVVRKGHVAFLAGCALLCILASILVTVNLHVPWNIELAEANYSAETAAVVWSNYSKHWTAWNHLRTAACVASLCFILATMYQWRRVRYVDRMPI